MSKKIALSIAEPCHENWESMSPDEKGRFCGSCQKQVIDFSTMSDRELAQFFKKPSTGSVCGRFMTDQLNREMEIHKKRIPWVKYFFSILLPAFFWSKASAQDIKTGKIKPVEKDTTRTPMLTEPRMLGMVIKNNIEPVFNDTTISEPVLITKAIKGKIVDETGNPVPFASIQIGKTLNTYMADEKGAFSISNELVGDNQSFLVTSVGFESKEVAVNRSLDFMTIEMKSILLDEVVVTGYATVKGKVSVTMGLVASAPVCTEDITDDIIERDIPVPASQNKVFVYPNPVLAGGNITLGISMLEEGYYSIQFINVSGQQLQQKEIWIDGEARVLNIDVPKLSAGTYFLVLTNKNSKIKYTEKIMVH